MGNTSFMAEKQGVILGTSRSGKTTLFNNLVIKRYVKDNYRDN
jgi:ADP-ribosylation factor family